MVRYYVDEDNQVCDRMTDYVVCSFRNRELAIKYCEGLNWNLGMKDHRRS